MSPTRRMAWLSLATSLATLGLKFGAYALTGSVSLLSDALEAFVNIAAALAALAALTIAERPPDAGHPYGHDKAQYFSSGAEGVLILGASAAIVYAAIGRLLEPTELERLGPGLLVAGLAAAMNLVTARLMFRVARSHDSISLEADAQHLMTDVWTSVGVIAGLGVVLLEPGWAVLDPLIAIVVALHIAWVGVGLLRRSTAGLMDTALPDDELATLRAAIAAELPPGTRHGPLLTRRAGPRRFVEFTLQVPGHETVSASHALCDRLETRIGAALPRTQVTIHVEPLG